MYPGGRPTSQSIICQYQEGAPHRNKIYLQEYRKITCKNRIEFNTKKIRIAMASISILFVCGMFTCLYIYLQKDFKEITNNIDFLFISIVLMIILSLYSYITTM